MIFEVKAGDSIRTHAVKDALCLVQRVEAETLIVLPERSIVPIEISRYLTYVKREGSFVPPISVSLLGQGKAVAIYAIPTGGNDIPGKALNPCTGTRRNDAKEKGRQGQAVSEKKAQKGKKNAKQQDNPTVSQGLFRQQEEITQIPGQSDAAASPSASRFAALFAPLPDGR